MRLKGFIGPSYTLSSRTIECQRAINLIPELNENGTAKEGEIAHFISAPGKSLFGTVGDGPIRGMWRASNGTLYSVSRNKLYSVNSSGVETERGTLNTTSGKVSMADNGIHLMLVDGTFGYTLTLASNSFAQITDPDFPGADIVRFVDGYFLFNIPGTGRFGITGLNDVTVDALDIATAEGAPDNLISIIVDHRDVWLFGETSTEIFTNTGNADFPFERISGAFVEHGIAAAHSAAKGNNTVFWLGGDDKGHGVVYMAQGYQPQKISTHAIDLAIQSYGDLSDATGYTYQQNGHFYYVLNFTNANTSWVYDSVTGLWHERVSTYQGQFQRDRGDCHAFAYGKHIVGDYENGNLYELSHSVYTDNGAVLTRQRVGPHTTNDGKRVTYHSFEAEAETGVGLDGSGQGTDPQIVLEFSDDGGRTWSNEKWVSMGRIGQTKSRAKWNRLGMGRDRVFRLTYTEPTPYVLTGANIEVEPGVS